MGNVLSVLWESENTKKYIIILNIGCTLFYYQYMWLYTENQIKYLNSEETSEKCISKIYVTYCVFVLQNLIAHDYVQAYPKKKLTCTFRFNLN